jgi:hypothetical protein
MSTTQSLPRGRDLVGGTSGADTSDGSTLAGHVGDEPVALARRSDEFFAIDAKYTN